MRESRLNSCRPSRAALWSIVSAVWSGLSFITCITTFLSLCRNPAAEPGKRMERDDRSRVTVLQVQSRISSVFHYSSNSTVPSITWCPQGTTFPDGFFLIGRAKDFDFHSAAILPKMGGLEMYVLHKRPASRPARPDCSSD